MTTQEIWKPIKNLPIGYEVSNLGNVRIVYTDAEPKPVQQRINSVYKVVNLCGKQYKIHRLVAENFIEHTSDKNLVKHIDGNLHNNCVDNLKWISYVERTGNYIERCKFYIRVKETGQIFATISSASYYMNIDVQAIQNSMTTGHPAFGYHFEVIDINEENKNSAIYISKSMFLELSQTLEDPSEIKSYF